MSFHLIKCLHKGGSSTTNVQSYTPTAEETRMQNAAANYAEYVAPNARWLNDTAADILRGSIGSVQVDFNGMNNRAQQQIANAQNGVANLTNGILPSAYQQNMENSIRSGVKNTTGDIVRELGEKGVLNSSITTQKFYNQDKAVADTMAEQYQNNIGTLNGLYGQQSQLASAGITTGAAAQEAAQTPALNLWNASLGLNGAGTSALGAVAGTGTTTSTSSTSGGGSGWLGGLVGLGSAAIGAFCFVAGTLIDTFKGETPIEKIKVGDQVYAYDEQRKRFELHEVIDVQEPHEEECFKVTCIDDKGQESSVECTALQPLLTENGMWVDVNLLKLNTKLLLVGEIKSIEKVGRKMVYDVRVDGINNYVANGFVAEGMFGEW